MPEPDYTDVHESLAELQEEAARREGPHDADRPREDEPIDDHDPIHECPTCESDDPAKQIIQPGSRYSGGCTVPRTLVNDARGDTIVPSVGKIPPCPDPFHSGSVQK